MILRHMHRKIITTEQREPVRERQQERKNMKKGASSKPENSPASFAALAAATTLALFAAALGVNALVELLARCLDVGFP
jgi:hypothetical protein